MWEVKYDSSNFVLWLRCWCGCCMEQTLLVYNYSVRRLTKYWLIENKMQQHQQWGGNVFGVSLNTVIPTTTASINSTNLNLYTVRCGNNKQRADGWMHFKIDGRVARGEVVRVIWRTKQVPCAHRPQDNQNKKPAALKRSASWVSADVRMSVLMSPWLIFYTVQVWITPQHCTRVLLLLFLRVQFTSTVQDCYFPFDIQSFT